LKHADDFCEVSSESSAETARTWGFDLETESLKFNETIVTVKYHPGEATWAAILKDDSRKLIDQSDILSKPVLC
jgi:hypothetical protein